MYYLLYYLLKGMILSAEDNIILIDRSILSAVHNLGLLLFDRIILSALHNDVGDSGASCNIFKIFVIFQVIINFINEVNLLVNK